MAVARHQIAIGAAHGAEQQLVADRTAIDEQVLLAAGRPVEGGQADEAAQTQALALGVDRPVGQTDSELAFCALLTRLRPLWVDEKLPSLESRMTLLADFAADLRKLGAANFLYADGDAVFSHGHRRLTGVEGRIEPPGLFRYSEIGVSGFSLARCSSCAAASA